MFNLADVLLARAQRHPDRIAIESQGLSLSYQDMMARASNVAGLLRAEGVEPGDRVGVALSANAETLISVIGLWIAGATALISDFRSRGFEREKLATALDLKFYIEDRRAPGGGDYPALRLSPEVFQESDVVHPVSGYVTTNPAAVLGVSSGTSGMPQPVVLTHDCLFLRSALAHSSEQWQPGGRFLASAPLGFSATRKHVLTRLIDGGTVIFSPLLASPALLAKTVIDSKATAFLAVPATVRALLDLANDDGPLFPTLDYFLVTGASMTPKEKIDCLEKLSNGFVFNYGSSMAGMISVLRSDEVARHSHTVGRPLDHVLVQIVDAELEVMPSGSEGTIRVRTPGIGDQVNSTGVAARDSDLVVDGWIYPGDIGSLDANGFLSVLGRTSDLINRGGVNVYPSEVEAVLSSHDAVTEAAVVGIPDPLLGEEIVAFVTTQKPVESRELMTFCAGKLHTDKQPRIILQLDRMPVNANGKLVRRDLRDKILNDLESDSK